MKQLRSSGYAKISKGHSLIRHFLFVHTTPPPPPSFSLPPPIFFVLTTLFPPPPILFAPTTLSRTSPSCGSLSLFHPPPILFALATLSPPPPSFLLSPFHSPPTPSFSLLPLYHAPPLSQSWSVLTTLSPLPPSSPQHKTKARKMLQQQYSKMGDEWRPPKRPDSVGTKTLLRCKKDMQEQQCATPSKPAERAPKDRW